MAMNLGDVATKRKALAIARQGVYEELLTAIENDVDAARKIARKKLNDIQEREDTLNQIEGLINLIATMP